MGHSGNEGQLRPTIQIHRDWRLALTLDNTGELGRDPKRLSFNLVSGEIISLFSVFTFPLRRCLELDLGASRLLLLLGGAKRLFFRRRLIGFGLFYYFDCRRFLRRRLRKLGENRIATGDEKARRDGEQAEEGGSRHWVY